MHPSPPGVSDGRLGPFREARTHAGYLLSSPSRVVGHFSTPLRSTETLAVCGVCGLSAQPTPLPRGRREGALAVPSRRSRGVGWLGGSTRHTRTALSSFRVERETPPRGCRSVSVWAVITAPSNRDSTRSRPYQASCLCFAGQSRSLPLPQIGSLGFPDSRQIPPSVGACAPWAWLNRGNARPGHVGAATAALRSHERVFAAPSYSTARMPPHSMRVGWGGLLLPVTSPAWLVSLVDIRPAADFQSIEPFIPSPQPTASLVV